MAIRISLLLLLFFIGFQPVRGQLNYERLAANACDCLPSTSQLTQSVVDSCLAESASEAVFTEIIAHGSIEMEVEGLNELYDLSLSYLQASCQRVAQFMLLKSEATDPRRPRSERAGR